MAWWDDIDARRKRLEISRAEMARRAGISESTVTKGMKRGTKPIPSVRRQIEKVLADEAAQRNIAS